MGAGLGELDAVPGVWQLTGTDGAGVGLGVDRINGQRHGNNGVAAINSWQSGGLSTSFGELNAVPSIWQLAGTNGFGISYRVNRINGQRHCHHRVATIDGWQGDGLCSGFSKLYAIPSDRQFVDANGLGVGFGVDRINGQRHRHHRVATIHCRKSDGLGSGFGELYPIPSNWQLAGADDSGLRF